MFLFSIFHELKHHFIHKKYAHVSHDSQNSLCILMHMQTLIEKNSLSLTADSRTALMEACTLSVNQFSYRCIVFDFHLCIC